MNNEQLTSVQRHANLERFQHSFLPKTMGLKLENVGHYWHVTHLKTKHVVSYDPITEEVETISKDPVSDDAVSGMKVLIEWFACDGLKDSKKPAKDEQPEPKWVMGHGW